MASRVDDVTSLVEGLRIADKTSDVNVQISDLLSSPPPALQGPIQMLIQSAKDTASQTQHTQSLAGATSLLSSLDITGVFSLHKTANEITKVIRILEETTQTLKNAAESNIITNIVLLGRQGGANIHDGSLLMRLLSHFDKQIRKVVRGVLDVSNCDNCILWKSAEECYNQGTNYTGTLHPDNYFVPREEACLGWPFDSDYEAEEYYEHENRLDLDEGYAKAFEQQCERRSEAKRKERQSWVDFWIVVLNSCPGGPRLFYPPASSAKFSKFRTEDVPPYLFRTFERES